MNFCRFSRLSWREEQPCRNSARATRISMTGEVTIVHDDGTVTVHLHGYDIPLTTR